MYRSDTACRRSAATVGTTPWEGRIPLSSGFPCVSTRFFIGICAVGRFFESCQVKRARDDPRPLSVLVLAEGRRVEDAAIGPQGVEATCQTDRGLLADVLLEHLAVVAYGRDRAHGPVGVEADHFAEVTLGAEQAVDLGAVGR